MELLKGKVTPFQQALNKWRSLRTVPFRKKFFVGYDLDGNTYWEFKNYNDPYRMRRIVEYRRKAGHLSHVDYDSKRVAPQWMQWLRFNRPTYPSLEELYADQVRQAQLKYRIEAAEKKWKSVPLKEQFQSSQAPPQKQMGTPSSTSKEQAEQLEETSWKPKARR